MAPDSIFPRQGKGYGWFHDVIVTMGDKTVGYLLFMASFGGEIAWRRAALSWGEEQSGWFHGVTVTMGDKKRVSRNAKAASHPGDDRTTR